MGTLFQDLRFGVRMLAKSPGFAAIAILTLALGIGANTAIFSLIDGILLRPLPYPESSRIVHVSWRAKSGEIPDLNVPQFKFCRDHGTVFAALAGEQGTSESALNTAGTIEWVKAAQVTDGFFETLGANFQLGRGFSREFAQPGGPYGAVLTDSLWRNSFGADTNIIGKQIVLDTQSYTVTGVLPPAFKFTEPADAFVSLHLGNSLGDMGTNTDVIGRLKPGVSLSRAEAEVQLLGQEFQAQATSAERQETSGSFHLEQYQAWLGSDNRMSLLMLLSAVGLLLLIACANVASLLLARASSRQKEISVRLALGASRGRLLEQFLVESLILGGAGAAAGLTGAAVILRAFVAAIPWSLPAVDRIELDGRVLLFTVLIGIGASVAFSLASFFQTRKLDLNETLKEGRTIAGVGQNRGRFLSALVVGEIAVSLMLALGAGLLIDSLYNLYQEQLGFSPSHVVLFSTPFSSATPPAGGVWNFEREALARIEAIPGVQSAAVVSVAPLHGQGNLPTQREGHSENSIGGMEYRAVSSNYFTTMEIAIDRGRAFNQADFSSSTPVAVIDETLARRWWPNGNPIGDHVVVGEYQGRNVMQPTEPPREIIGVVADTKGMQISQPARPMIYVPASQSLMMGGSTDWVVRATAPAGIADALQKAITAIAPEQRVVDLEPFSQLISDSVAQPNFEALLMGAFGALALALTLVGVYGVLSFQVSERTHELGVRMALGARPRDVMRLVIGKAAILAGLGVAIGVGAALGLSRLMTSLLYQVKPTDPWIFAGAALLVLIVAMLAAYVPARRAMRVDPMVALRYE
ncbi:MAG TPA: ABC transporter permease [Candidatus Methylomirabilis sp.]|nr:ABC transporter permease [Candidatus Methylomirabilis sp.]